MVGDDPAAVEQNAQLMYGSLNLVREQACTVWQVHGEKVVYAKEALPDRHWLDQADAIITDQVDLPLNLRFADCVPILFYDPVKHVLGLAHAGWRGTVGGVTAGTVRAMADQFGSRPADLQAAIGPSISVKAYQVGEEVVGAVQAAFGTLDGLVQRASDGSAYLDLWACNRLALERAGVASHNIEISGVCTATHTDEFFSHRAEKGKTGRFGAVMALRAR
jgi:hypothetical protein